MPLDAPFRLGPFVVDTLGRVEPGDPGRFPVFHLNWRGYAVHARLDTCAKLSPTSGRLLFNAVLGRVPSTAGGDAGRNAIRRARSFDAVRGLGGALRAEWRLSLLADHRIAIEASRDLHLPVSAVDLVTQVTCFLLDLAPYLDWLDEVELGGGAAAGGGGTTNT
jgi:hypothetical protein